MRSESGRHARRALLAAVAVAVGLSAVLAACGAGSGSTRGAPGVTLPPPGDWPNDRFDVIWTFTRTADGWHFAQQPELLLPHDQDSVID